MSKPTDLVFGIHPVMEAIAAGKAVDKVLIQRQSNGDNIRDLLNMCRDRDIPFQTVPPEKLNRVTRKNHQGVIAFISPVHFFNLEDVVPQLYEDGKTPLLLLLDGVTDTRNFGAIVRTAECAGVHAVIVPSKGAARIGADAGKTSAGALFKMPICKVKDLHGAVRFLKDSGVQIVACTEKTQDSYLTPDYAIPTAVVMGSEEDGISKAILADSNHRAMIPLQGSLGSLNVSVACGIILYEAVRQRIN